MTTSSDSQPPPPRRRFTTATQPSRRKQAIRELSDRLAPERDRWIARNGYFHEEDRRYMRFLIPEGLSVLDLGCGTGQLLAALNPSRGVGIDFSEGMIEVARRNHPGLEFRVGDVEDPSVLAALDGPFDVIVLSDTIGSLNDCESMLGNLHGLCGRDTRLVIAYYSFLWEPVLTLAEKLGLKMPQGPQNYLSAEDIAELLALADFEVIRREWRQLVPLRLFGLGPFLNRYIGTLPWIRRVGLRNCIVARPLPPRALGAPSATVVIPCKNERGNIEPAVRRLPQFCDDLEVLFVEGGSRDGTLEEINRVIAAFPERDIKVIQQDGTGKGNAVRKGFSVARGEVLIILDADLTVPPEWLPRFYHALAEGKGEFINGTRLIYPLEKQAMRLLNYFANRVFSWLFTWLLNQRFTDTLCGTKALSKRHYEKIAANRAYFGAFDPFGDFDLIFGATKLNLKVIEVPVRYGARTYGETQISRFTHGWLLLRMVALAYRKLKAF
ncbi:MAG: glycosyltransferase [Proteobacteria bacterium]|nr:glycosyltransferase [Pseudomonadota bacterium]